MKKVRVTRTVTIPHGTIGLSAKQAAKRANCLKKTKGGAFEVLQPVQFKVGEEIEVDEIEKSIEEHFEAVVSAAPADSKEKS